METFTFIRKKLIDEMFSDEMTMRSWVYEASLGSFVQVVDANLIGMEDENVSAKKECASSILHLALGCSTATERISMEDFVVFRCIFEMPAATPLTTRLPASRTAGAPTAASQPHGYLPIVRLGYQPQLPTRTPCGYPPCDRPFLEHFGENFAINKNLGLSFGGRNTE
ncbi:hypothetical protein LguiB_017983 [Lonicera macranthoides]